MGKLNRVKLQNKEVNKRNYDILGPIWEKSKGGKLSLNFDTLNMTSIISRVTIKWMQSYCKNVQKSSGGKGSSFEFKES